MKKNVIFVYGDEQLELPVTPQSFEVSTGMRSETINLTNIGEVELPGKKSVFQIQLSSFFPLTEYDFVKKQKEPYEYTAWFEEKARANVALRVIVTNTSINRKIRIKSIDYGEKDGSGDVYYTLTLSDAEDFITKTAVQSGTATTVQTAAQRTDEPVEQQQTVEDYVIQSGDCLIRICRKKYGDGSLWAALQKYNGLPSTLIITGKTLKLPPKSVLTGS